MFSWTPPLCSSDKKTWTENKPVLNIEDTLEDTLRICAHGRATDQKISDQIARAIPRGGAKKKRHFLQSILAWISPISMGPIRAMAVR